MTEIIFVLYELSHFVGKLFVYTWSQQETLPGEITFLHMNKTNYLTSQNVFLQTEITSAHMNSP